MRIIFSRKGLDSSNKGCPSPILENDRIFSLPIPDISSRIKYEDLSFESINFGKMISNLTRDRIKPNYKAHLDPDLTKNTKIKDLERSPEWRPLFGQMNQSLSHLFNNNVQEGDLFLFYGLYKRVKCEDGKWMFVRGERKLHILWGWLQIDKIIDINKEEVPKWASYHPHVFKNKDKQNCLFIAKEKLELPGFTRDIKGGGVFPKVNDNLILTARNSNKPSLWELPSWFFPDGKKTPLTYHSNLDRWTKQNGKVFLQTVGRGQEFVLNTKDYPEAIDWLKDLFQKNL